MAIDMQLRNVACTCPYCTVHGQRPCCISKSRLPFYIHAAYLYLCCMFKLCSTDTYMQQGHGHAASAWTCHMDMGMYHGHGQWACIMHAAWTRTRIGCPRNLEDVLCRCTRNTCNVHVLYISMLLFYVQVGCPCPCYMPMSLLHVLVHAAWTKDKDMQHGHGRGDVAWTKTDSWTWACSIDKDKQHVLGHAAWT
jgi:hypothetical protein